MSFNTPWFNQQDPSFFNALNKSKVVHVILCADSDDFAEEVIHQWRAEGFNVLYVPFGNGGKDFVERVRRTGENTGVGEQYAVVGKYFTSYDDLDDQTLIAFQLSMKPPPSCWRRMSNQVHHGFVQ
jgi:hypothetical protein